MHGNRDHPSGLVGGIGLTEVHVYAQRHAPDGQYSGCPHVHAVTPEGYYVLAGSGAVEFHDLEHGYRKLPLVTGQYMHFPPWVMHRLVSDGTLVILGIMGNAGLAESGEARIYFGKAIDEDPERFAATVALPKQHGLEGALRRRDTAVEGYMSLMKLWEQDREAYFAELKRFFASHATAMASRREALRAHVASGPAAWTDTTLRALDRLPSVEPESTEVFANLPGTDSALGMCGVLRPILSLDRR